MRAHPIRVFRGALRVNFVPGLILQGLLGIIVLGYFLHEGVKESLHHLASLRAQAGMLFTFFACGFAAGVLPEILKVALFQRGRPAFQNLRNLAFTFPYWGFNGLLVDIFYRLQNHWFGSEVTLRALTLKVIVDQALYSPLIAAPLCVIMFTWRALNFAPRSLRLVFAPHAFFDKWLVNQISSWMVWIPAVILIYTMPPALQIPVYIFAACFWGLVVTTIMRPAEAPAVPEKKLSV